MIPRELRARINTVEQNINLAYALGKEPTQYILNRYDKLVAQYNKLKPNNKLFTLGDRLDVRA